MQSEEMMELEAVALTADAWDLVRAELGLTGIAKQLARKAKDVKFAEGGLVLMHLDYADRALAEEPYAQRLQDALSELFSQDLFLGITIKQSH